MCLSVTWPLLDRTLRRLVREVMRKMKNEVFVWYESAGGCMGLFMEGVILLVDGVVLLMNGVVLLMDKMELLIVGVRMVMISHHS